MNLAELHLTAHAIERYRDRVKPGLSREAAKAELRDLVKLAERVDRERPGWAVGTGEHADGFLTISEGIVLVCERDRDGVWHALTCLTRGGTGSRRREYLNRKRQARQAQRRRRRQKWTERHAGKRDKRLGRRPAGEQDGDR